MAGKININPDTVKGNLGLIIVVVATLGLLGYGWLQLDATGATRADSSQKLESQTRTYNEKKNYALPEALGLTNSTGGRLDITTHSDVDKPDESHLNIARVKEAGTNFVSHLNQVRTKFAPLAIPDGLELDEKTGAIKRVTLMQRGTKYYATAPSVTVMSVRGEGAELVASTRSMGGDTPEQYYVEKIDVINGGKGYTRGDIAIIIGDDFIGGGGFDPSLGGDPAQGGDPGLNAPPGGMAMSNQMGMIGMPGMGMMGSGGVSEDDSEARYGLDNDTFRDFMQSTVFGLQSRCKAQRIRLPKIDDEEREFRFSFSKIWDTFEFEPHERELMSHQLAEIEVLCNALFAANVHEIYNLKRLKVVRNPTDMDMGEDSLEYLHEMEFSLNDVMEFASGNNADSTPRLNLVPGARVLPYEVTFRGFSSELSKVLEELYKSKVFFVVKNIAVIEATDVVDVFEEEEKEMSLGAFGGTRSGREMYGGMGARGMMDPRYQAMLYGGQDFGENKRQRPASLLLDESPLKVTIKINSLKVVAKEKDESDAITALAQKIVDAEKKEDEEGGDQSSTEDSDEDGFYDWEEELTGHDPNDKDSHPTQEEVDAKLEAADEIVPAGEPGNPAGGMGVMNPYGMGMMPYGMGMGMGMPGMMGMGMETNRVEVQVKVKDELELRSVARKRISTGGPPRSFFEHVIANKGELCERQKINGLFHQATDPQTGYSAIKWMELLNRNQGVTHLANVNPKDAALERHLARQTDRAFNMPNVEPQLHRLAREGNVYELSFALSRDPDPNLRDGRGRTALHVAAASGRVSLMKQLLSLGADPAAVDQYGFTALHWAAQHGQLESARHLVEEVKVERVADQFSRTPAALAKSRGHAAVTDYLSAN